MTDNIFLMFQISAKKYIDPTVFEELPEDIRKEIIHEYRLETTGELSKAQPKIELSVLDELPKDIRNEVVKEYNLTSLPSTSTACIEERLSCSPDTEVLQSTGVAVTETALELRETGKKCSRRIQYFSDLTWKELKEMFIVWLKAETIPKPVDVSMLGEYVKQMALDRQIEQLEVLLRFLHR